MPVKEELLAFAIQFYSRRKRNFINPNGNGAGLIQNRPFFYYWSFSLITRTERIIRSTNNSTIKKIHKSADETHYRPLNELISNNEPLSDLMAFIYVRSD